MGNSLWIFEAFCSQQEASNSFSDSTGYKKHSGFSKVSLDQNPMMKSN